MDEIDPQHAELEELSSTVILTGDRDVPADSPAPRPFNDNLLGAAVGNYRIDSVIGRGAMGTVYKAHHALLSKDFAIKVLHPHLCSDEQALRRFKQEAQSASKLDHRGIIGVHDFGVMTDGRPYLTMDYVSGPNLSELIKGGPILPLARAMSMCAKICDALSEAHTKGIVHRDIKPSNILVINPQTPQEEIKVVDFGIAKILSEQQLQSLTQTGESIGSPPYMSPEQCQALPLDARSDIYSLGCMTYEMLTGVSPFRADSVYEVIHKQLHALPDSITKHRPDLANGLTLDAVLLRALAKEPAKRYQSIAEFKDALSAASASKPNLIGNIKTKCEITATRYANRRTAAVASVMAISALLCILSLQIFTARPEKTTATGYFKVDAAADSAQRFSALKRTAHDLYQQGKIAAAEVAYRNALETGKPLGQQNPEMRSAMEELAAVYKELHKTAEGEQLQARLKMLRDFESDRGDLLTNNTTITKLMTERLKSPQDAALRDRLVNALSKQASLYRTQGDFPNAISSANAAIVTAGGITQDNAAKLTEAISVLAIIHSDQFDFSSAKNHVDQLLTLSGKTTPETASVANAYMTAGRFYARRASQSTVTRQERVEDLSRAWDFYKRAESIVSKLYPNTTSPLLADIFTDESMVLRLKGAFPEASSVAKQACEANGSIRGLRDPRTGKALYNLALIRVQWALSIAETEPAHAKKLMQDAEKDLAIAENSFVQTSTAETTLLTSIAGLRGRICEYLGDDASAEKYYDKAFTNAVHQNRKSDAAVYAYSGLMRIYTKQKRQSDIDTLMRSTPKSPSKSAKSS